MSLDFKRIFKPDYEIVSEGPVWDGRNLLFTLIQDSKIMRYNPENGKTEVFMSDTNHANGLKVDSQGRLYACEGGSRRVVRYEKNGSVTVLADKFQEKRLNMPNDLTIDDKGGIWFTDPWYEGTGGEWSKDRTQMELGHESVYRLDPRPDGSYSIQRVVFDTTRPNGILFSLDFKTLYVAQSGRLQTEKKELRAYPVKADGTLDKCTVLYDFYPYRGVDGMCLDAEGNIWATAGNRIDGGPGPMIYVFSPDGKILERHMLPEPVVKPTNCAFGGPELDTLYVTTGNGSVYEVKTGSKGRLIKFVVQ